VLTRTTYIGRHRFNTRIWKTREHKPDADVVEIAALAIIDAAEFEAVQAAPPRPADHSVCAAALKPGLGY
jgi:hypothetical protein